MSATGWYFFVIEKVPMTFERREKVQVSKIKFQNFIFTLMTVILMAYSMIVYNVAINSSDGLINKTFLIALKEFPIECIVVFVFAYFVASPIAKKN